MQERKIGIGGFRDYHIPKDGPRSGNAISGDSRRHGQFAERLQHYQRQSEWQLELYGGSTPAAATLLTLQTPLNNGNPLYAALSSGYWGTGNNLNSNTPDLFKAQVNGSSAGETNNDFLAGNVVGHSPNAGDYLFVTWTAPSAGSVGTQSGEVWYAHSSVTRSNDWVLLFDSVTLTSGTVTSVDSLLNPEPFSSSGFAMNAGDTISLGIKKTAGQTFGSLAGLALTFNFTPSQTPVPEPGTCLALLGGLAVLAIRSRFHLYSRR